MTHLFMFKKTFQAFTVVLSLKLNVFQEAYALFNGEFLAKRKKADSTENFLFSGIHEITRPIRMAPGEERKALACQCR